MTIAAFLAGIIGVLVGGLINLLADYLPATRAATLHDNSPPSAFYPTYPDGTRRPPLAWLGLLAFLTRQYTAPTGSKLLRRHILVEIGLGVAYAWFVTARPWDLNLFFQLAFLAFLLLIAVIDIEHKIIPLVVILPACVLALIAAWLVPEPPPNITNALLGGLVGFAIYFAFFLGGILFSTLTNTNEVAFGFGDVLLGILSGMILGYMSLLFAVFVTILLGAAGAALYLGSRIITRGRYSLFTALPYGPYIALATALLMFWRIQVVQIIFGV